MRLPSLGERAGDSSSVVIDRLFVLDAFGFGLVFLFTTPAVRTIGAVGAFILLFSVMELDKQTMRR